MVLGNRKIGSLPVCSRRECLVAILIVFTYCKKHEETLSYSLVHLIYFKEIQGNIVSFVHFYRLREKTGLTVTSNVVA